MTSQLTAGLGSASKVFRGCPTLLTWSEPWDAVKTSAVPCLDKQPRPTTSGASVEVFAVHRGKRVPATCDGGGTPRVRADVRAVSMRGCAVTPSSGIGVAWVCSGAPRRVTPCSLAGLHQPLLITVNPVRCIPCFGLNTGANRPIRSCEPASCSRPSGGGGKDRLTGSATRGLAATTRSAARCRDAC